MKGIENPFAPITPESGDALVVSGAELSRTARFHILPAPPLQAARVPQQHNRPFSRIQGNGWPEAYQGTQHRKYLQRTLEVASKVLQDRAGKRYEEV